MKNNTAKRWVITLFRAAIGWHFLYEGMVKLWDKNWSAASYLANAAGPFAGFYHWMADSDFLMQIIDPLNIAALLLIGLALFLGVFVRAASVCGILLLALYYFADPPFGIASLFQSGGSYYIVNPNFIESVALLLLFFMKEKGYGIYAFKEAFGRKKGREEPWVDNKEAILHSRREVLKNLATLPALGFIGWGAFDNRKYGIDTLSGATIQIGASELKELKGELPRGKIGNHSISRLILGGNLIGGWAHSRDLIYVPSLFRAYNTEKKIVETLLLAEKAGINTINIGFPTIETMVKYRKAPGSKMKVICQVHPDMEKKDYFVNINTAIDSGMDIIQIQGNWCDWLVRDNQLDVIEKMLEKIRSQGYVAGLAAHTVDSLIVCEAEGIIPDYYMKTMHHDRYWSAHPRENRVPFEVDGEVYLDHNKFHDNCFCPFPERTVEFVQQTNVPVMGFKVLAAGAIPPEDGFEWAFQNGADFICVGMFDFQIVNDVNIALDVLDKVKERKRKWHG